MIYRLSDIFALIDEANGRDPEMAGDEQIPAALLYGQRMSDALDGFLPDAGEELRIACRAQHLERWLLPRSDYPMTRPGYHAWRNEQKRRHADRVSELMAQAGYDETARARVASLVRKEGIKRDAEAQTLEDIACLVFLEHYAAAFAAGHDEAKVIDILRKTWRKMSAQGHDAALKLPLDASIKAAVGKALEAT